ncbi:ATP synthase F1 subunit delta [Candidatus Parcubacteria bacterium]|nr:MAG: ATP synthase F1 subunit delta [Candidatus Parcubacteria bacterium]
MKKEKEMKKLAEIFVDTVEGKSQNEVREIVAEFVKFLADNRLLTKWRKIEQEISKVWKEKYGFSKIKVVSAHELSQEMKKMITDFAKGADVEMAVDSRLIGGAIVRFDDKRIDGSILGKLQRLKTELTD